jgi:hypothetical protein
MAISIKPKTPSKVAVSPTKASTPYVMVLGSGASKGMQRREDVERAAQPRGPSIRIVPKPKE